MIFLVRVREQRGPGLPKLPPETEALAFVPVMRVRIAARNLPEPALQRRGHSRCWSWWCSSRKAFSEAVATAPSPLALLASGLSTVQVRWQIGGVRWEARQLFSHGLSLLCRASSARRVPSGGAPQSARTPHPQFCRQALAEARRAVCVSRLHRRLKSLVVVAVSRQCYHIASRFFGKS